MGKLKGSNGFRSETGGVYDFLSVGCRNTHPRWLFFPGKKEDFDRTRWHYCGKEGTGVCVRLAPSRFIPDAFCHCIKNMAGGVKRLFRCAKIGWMPVRRGLR